MTSNCPFPLESISTRMSFEEDFYTFFENTTSIPKDFEASAQCTDELLKDDTDMGSKGSMAVNADSNRLRNNDMIYGGTPQWSPIYEWYGDNSIIGNTNAQAGWIDVLPFPYLRNPVTTIPLPAYTNSDLTAVAPHVPISPESDTPPAVSPLSPHFGGYHGLLVGAGRFDSSPQHTAAIKNPAQSQAYSQPSRITHAAETHQFHGANIRNQQYTYVDPQVFVDDSPTVDASPPTALYPAPTSPNSSQMPALTYTSWDSTAFTSATTPTFSSTPPTVSIMSASPPMREVQPAPAWALKELPPPTAQQSTSTWMKEWTRKRTLDDMDINEDARAGQSGAVNRPQTRKRLKTLTTKARASLPVDPSIGTSYTTAVGALNRKPINSEASGQGDRIPRTVAPEALPALGAGPSKHPRSKTSPTKKREPVAVTEEVLQERKKTNKQIQDDRTRHVKVSGKWMAICCWDGCMNDPFTRPSDAVRHIRRIHLDQRWVCNERDCGKALSRKDSLRRHVNTVHKDLRAVETKGGEKVGKRDQPADTAEDAETDGEGHAGSGEGSGSAAYFRCGDDGNTTP